MVNAEPDKIPTDAQKAVGEEGIDFKEFHIKNFQT